MIGYGYVPFNIMSVCIAVEGNDMNVITGKRLKQNLYMTNNEKYEC